MVENNGKALLELGQKIIIKLAEYLDASQGGQIPVVQMKPIDNLIEELDLSELANGSLNCENVEKLLDTYLANTMHLHHPAYIGHQVSVPHIGSAFAELIHGVVNQPMSLYEMGPAAAAMEQFVVHWMLQKVGWTTGGGGVMTHGGSLANITALLTARSQMSPEAWTQGNPSNLVVLAPENAHYSISRAVSILGLGQNAMIPIPTDKSEIIIPDQIPRIFDAERQKGNQVMAIVANGCATSTGYFDPIEEVGHFCRENKVWFHVDSPHGATALLSDKYKHQVQGIELADSMIWDAHKMMRTSTLCTAILYRDQKSMLQTFTQKASYLFHEKENAGVDTMG
ncbi:MAG: PLP-dependent decarboxylase, partial [Saprospiraceae bacterium]|nr:PLP-dependent decarboxylase [Saprospiraceae bacterium]